MKQIGAWGGTMIKSQIVTIFSVGDDLPGYSHLPHGTTHYEKLLGYHEMDQLEHLIQIEISNLVYSLDKYDSQYEPEHKKMCVHMRQIQKYLQGCLNVIHNLKK